MNLDLAHRFDALTRALPPLDAGAELILRPADDGATATLRTDGAPPRVFTTAGDAVVERFAAADPGLPGAALLADAERLRAALAPHGVDVRASRLVAWRPGRRAVVRVLATDGSVRWLKLLDRKAWRRAAAAFAAVGSELPPLRLARPEALLPDACAYVAPDAAGTALRGLLGRGELPPTTVLVRGLLALGYTAVHAELPMHDFARARAAAVGSLQQGAVLHHELAELGAAIAELPTPPAPERLGFVHGDLHDKQLFVATDRVTVIDLEGMAHGDPRFDLANLAEHVRLRELQRDGRDSGFADQLLLRCGHGLEDAGMRAFRTVVRARLCGVYALRPRWNELVTRLLAETRQRTGGGA